MPHVMVDNGLHCGYNGLIMDYCRVQGWLIYHTYIISFNNINNHISVVSCEAFKVLRPFNLFWNGRPLFVCTDTPTLVTVANVSPPYDNSHG